MPNRQINITIGTAGHVDHGKTALVKLFTGCETDRLKEEKERGLTIELGFAPCTVDDLEVGIVDVPGHEAFVRTMVAGASGMDGVVLVVAADDGVMPQTREHLDVMTLLGVSHGIIALTKIDIVTPERVEEASAEIAEFTRGTFLEGAPILPVSSITGEGFGPFLEALSALIASIEPKSTAGVFRLPVERSFSVKGYGTVISGVPITGSAHVGDEIVLLPTGRSGRINAMQVYGCDSDVARCGQCAAINVRHWDHKGIGRGDVLTVPGFFEPASWFVLDLRMLPLDGLVLKNGTHLKFHTGTSERAATLYLLEGDVAAAGQATLAQIRLDEPLIAGPNDPFILRTLGPVRTVGGGRIVEAVPVKLKRTREGVVEDMKVRAAAVGNERAFVEYGIRTAEGGATREADLAFRTKMTSTRLRGILDELVEAGKALEPSAGLVVHADTLVEVGARVVETLARFHEENPQSPGMTPADLQEELALEKPLLAAVLDALRREGKVVERKGRLSLAEHEERFSPEDRRLLEAAEALFRDKPFSPPAEDDIAGMLRIDEKTARRIVGMLIEHQRLVRVPPRLLFHVEAVKRAKEILVDFIRAEGRLESVKFKYLLDTTRKFAIPLLDYFDGIGVTMRHGNTRFLGHAVDR